MEYRIIGHTYLMEFFKSGFQPSVRTEHVATVLHTQAIDIGGLPSLHFFTNTDMHESQILYLVDKKGDILCPVFQYGYANIFTQTQNDSSETLSTIRECLRESFLKAIIGYVDVIGSCETLEIERVLKLDKDNFIKIFTNRGFNTKTAIDAWKILHETYKEYEKNSPQ